jgi:hypothetical protein
MVSLVDGPVDVDRVEGDVRGIAQRRAQPVDLYGCIGGHEAEDRRHVRVHHAGTFAVPPTV